MHMSITRSLLRNPTSRFSFLFPNSSKQPVFKTLETFHPVFEDDCGDPWSLMVPDLLREIVRRVDSSGDRKDIVACSCVCNRWRDITKQIILSPNLTGKITLSSCLKLPGPRDFPIQCLIKRDKKSATFYLYLAVSPSSFMDTGKFLLAARRTRHGAHTEYIISLDANDLSQGSNAYTGKLSSNLLGTNFRIYDSQPPYRGAKSSSSRLRSASKQISPQISRGNFQVAQVSYRFNLLKSRGPRRMTCILRCPQQQEMHANNKIKPNEPEMMICQHSILKNKAPRWHENIQCWCLNFHGRVTVASVKNFQLVATNDQSHPGGGRGDEGTVLLQFGKVGDAVFTMDYRQPLSAFQAFAICLTSFGTKLACE